MKEEFNYNIESIYTTDEYILSETQYRVYS